MRTKPTKAESVSVDMAWNEGYVAGARDAWEIVTDGVRGCRQTIVERVSQKRRANRALSGLSNETAA